MSYEDKKINKYGRPKIKVPRSGLERILNIVSIWGVLSVWVYPAVSWGKLPDRIPTHFGFSGVPDSWGGKGSLLFLPIVVTFLYLLLTVISLFPQHYNYMTPITEENAARQYKSARTLMSWMTAELTFIFFFLEYQSIQAAKAGSSGLGIWFLPLSMIIVFGTMGYYIYKMIKLK